jgi:gas vesicle protein
MEDSTMGNPQVNDTPGGAGSSAVLGFVLGAVLGAGIALLLAPRSGKETRQRLADTGRRWGNAARDTVHQALDTANDLKEDAKSALAAGREAFEETRQSHEPRPGSRTERKT